MTTDQILFGIAYAVTSIVVGVGFTKIVLFQEVEWQQVSTVTRGFGVMGAVALAPLIVVVGALAGIAWLVGSAVSKSDDRRSTDR